MLKYLADENFTGHAIRGLLRHNTKIDIVRVQDVGLAGASDADILEWAAQHDRILLTHDASTVPCLADDRVRNGKRMPGVVIANLQLPFAVIIDDLLLLEHCSDLGEWNNQVLYLPL